jgi:hypothetical protein
VAIITNGEVALNAWVGGTPGFRVGAFVAPESAPGVCADDGSTRPAAATFSGCVRSHDDDGISYGREGAVGRARLSLKSMLYARLRCHVGGERTLCG